MVMKYLAFPKKCAKNFLVTFALGGFALPWEGVTPMSPHTNHIPGTAF
jgi:hypothetical protein